MSRLKAASKNGAGILQEWLQRLAGGGEKWELEKPLPTTRELAENYQISNVTAYRVLKKLTDQGFLWRKEKNGRYYIAAAREHLCRPKPVLCFLRHLEAWTVSYREIMAGFSAACGAAGRALLLSHIENLVQHANYTQPPVFGTPVEQKMALGRALRVGSEFQGILLDHLWRDEVLEPFRDALRNAVVLWRTTKIKEVSSVTPDFRLAATQALAHLNGKGFEKIWIAKPFEGDSATDILIESVIGVARELGMPLEKTAIHRAATEQDRHKLISDLLHSQERIALFCPEDNVSQLLYSNIREAKILCPKRVGILAGMGSSIVREKGMSSLVLPFRQMGVEAFHLIDRKNVAQVILPVRLEGGKTT